MPRQTCRDGSCRDGPLHIIFINIAQVIVFTIVEIRDGKMPRQFSVDLLILSELFSNRFKFDLPWYQRAYAWNTDHAKCLLADVGDAVANEKWYHLGLIILARPEDGPCTSIVDGQQRIVTLTILFAVLRDLTDDKDLHDLLNERIWLAHEARKPRLEPQDTIADCLLKYVQMDAVTGIMPSDEEISNLNCNEQNVIDNRNALREVLAECDQKELDRISRFLVNNCHLVVQELDNEDLAVRIYIKAHQSGLDLSPADILKANVVGYVSEHDRGNYSWVWSHAESRLGGAAFSELLGHLRDIKLRAKPRMPVEVDLIDHYRIKSDPRHFMDKVLAPAAELAIAIRDWSVGAGRSAEANEAHAAINRRLQYLSWVQHPSWKAPALHWLMVHGADHKDTPEFLARLEAFAFIHMLASTDTYVRRNEYYAVLAGIENETVLDDDGPLRVTKANIKKARARLMEHNFGKGGHNNKTWIMLRANAAVEGDREVIPAPFASIEHVLPRNAKQGSRWKLLFPDKASVAAYVQRLGNLAPLTGLENVEADNNDFDIKCKVFAGSKFALARTLPEHKEWTRKTIEKRTIWMIDLLFKAWRLK